MTIDRITTGAVLDGAIATADIADNAVTTAKITDANVTSAKIANLSIISGKLATNSVGTDAITDDAITGAKIENNPTIAGNLTVSGNFTSQGINDDADAVAMTIDSGENVAIGVTSKNSVNNGSLTIGHTGMTKVSTSANGNADELVLIGADASANVGMSIISNNANYCNIFFGDEDSNAQGLIQYNHAIDSLSFSSNGAEQLRLHSNGVLAASDGIALGVGVNNTAANVLDDYEEGTWTPTLTASSSNPTVSSYEYAVGVYTKIGRIVHAGIYLRILGGQMSGGSGDGRISGLPFTTSNTSSISFGGGGFSESWLKSNGSFSANRNTFKPLIGVNSNVFELWQYNGTNPQYDTGWGISQIVTGDLIVSGVFTYITDA